MPRDKIAEQEEHQAASEDGRGRPDDAAEKLAKIHRRQIRGEVEFHRALGIQISTVDSCCKTSRPSKDRPHTPLRVVHTKTPKTQKSQGFCDSSP